MKINVFCVMFSRQWWKTTLLVLSAVGVMVRLGFWQLDRLSQRRAFNTMVTANQSKPAIDLNESIVSSIDLNDMEYRSIRVSGIYDHRHQVVLRNQVYEDRLGVHLLTPLHISGKDQTVLIDRGWIPFEDFVNNRLDRYDEPGQVQVIGMIRLSDGRVEETRRVDLPQNPAASVAALKFVNLDKVEELIGDNLLPIYIQQAPDPDWNRLPHRILPEFDLTEGPHLGYAIQWFIFAGLLGVGYPFYIRREEARQQPKISVSQGSYIRYLSPEEVNISGSHKEDSAE